MLISVNHSQIVKLGGREYKIDIGKWSHYHTDLAWCAYRKDTSRGQCLGTWQKIPTSTRAEERRFPKDVGYVASAILETYIAATGD